ncbi:hypothetical protein WHL33_14310, partial [Staphylococcus aureus]|uniref:hypothetical protein n=1 Tax=Staphylococcus aureus TaxID=1280 RepID=UPI0039BDC225
ILNQGFLVTPLCSIGEVSNHDILGEFTDNNEDLSTWAFNEISKDAAIAIYSDNFIETPAEPESRRPKFTLDMALQYIFSNN